MWDQKMSAWGGRSAAVTSRSRPRRAANLVRPYDPWGALKGKECGRAHAEKGGGTCVVESGAGDKLARGSLNVDDQSFELVGDRADGGSPMERIVDVDEEFSGALELCCQFVERGERCVLQPLLRFALLP